jgi:hypothetical protein
MRTPGVRDNQHVVNLSVLLVSAAAAWFAPLQTFLLAYAIIGPFHYLTEIAWLRKKDFYFSGGVVSPRIFLAISLLLCSVACLDLYFKRGWAAYAIGALIVLALGALVKNIPVLMGALALLFVVRYFVHGYGLFLALFVPTVIHVYVFTLIFLVSGALRAVRTTVLSWLNPALLIAIPILLIKVAGGAGTPGAYWMTSEATFAPLHEYIAGVLGLTLHFDPSQPLNPAAIAVFRFLGFIYLHHYLNWFAKTELLAWHKVSRRSWAAIVVLYAAALGCYAYSFAAGFYAAYFLSLLHVLLELPLDWRSGMSVVAAPWKAWHARSAQRALRLVSDAPQAEV